MTDDDLMLRTRHIYFKQRQLQQLLVLRDRAAQLGFWDDVQHHENDLDALGYFDNPDHLRLGKKFL